MNLDDAVVLRKFYTMEEASIAASVLDSRGIECEVLPDDAGGAYPMLHMTAGIRLLVDYRSLDAARAVLEEVSDISDEELGRQAEAATPESDETEES